MINKKIFKNNYINHNLLSVALYYYSIDSVKSTKSESIGANFNKLMFSNFKKGDNYEAIHKHVNFSFNL